MQRIKTLLQKNKKHIYLGLLLGFVFAIGALTPNVSNAIFGFSLSGIVTGVFKLIAYVFNFVAGIFFAIAAAFVSFALDLNMTVADPKINTIADIGWRISRDIANLGFVLLTVIMAFTTIIRVQSYGAKKLLLNLIIAAVVVNFSFLIAGTLIDFSNTLTHFFIGRISPGGFGTGLTEVLANAFGPQKFMLEEVDDPIPPDPSQEESGLVTFGVAVLSSIAGLFFIVFFTLLATIVLLMLAGMFMLRYVVLTYLLVLAPLAWLFWVFPALKSQNGKWWGSFWQYTFFAPAASFFVYLSLVAAENLQKVEYQTKISAAIGGGLPGMLGKIAQQGTQLIVVSALMIGAITIAKSMGIAGADMANKAKDGLMKGAKTYAKNRATNLGTRFAQNKFVGGAMSRLGLSGKKLKGTGEDIQKQREAAKARHLEYQDKIATIKNDKNLTQKQKDEQIEKIEYDQKLKASSYKNNLKDLNSKKKEIEKDETRTPEQKEKDIKELEAQYNLESMRPARLGLGDKIGLWAKDKTVGAAKRGLGNIGEKTNQAVDKRATRKLESADWNIDLMKGAGEGVGLFKKAEKKDDKKTAAELEKDLTKKIKEKAAKLAMRNSNGLPRFKEEDLKEDNKQIEFAQQAVAAAYRNRLRTMETQDLDKEHSEALKQRAKAKTKDEITLANNKLEAARQTIKAKTGRMENAEQYEAALAKEKDRRDEAFVSGVDTTPYEKTISEYEGRMNAFLNKTSNRLDVFKKMDEKMDKLDKDRDVKLKEIAERTSKSAAETKNSDEFKAIETNVASAKSHFKSIESAISGRAQKLGELEKKKEDLQKVKNETNNLSDSKLSGWGITQEEKADLLKEIDRGILETQNLIDKKMEKKGDKKNKNSDEKNPLVDDVENPY